MLQDPTSNEITLWFYFIADAKITTEWKQQASEKQGEDAS